MPPLFADAGYWIALMHPGDQFHQRASALAKEFSLRRIVTTQMALAEALNSMANSGAHHRKFATDMVKRLRELPDVEIVPQTETRFWAAVERYDSRHDQSWGFVDCANFLVMEERGITEALAHDHDFEQAGFVALMRESS